MNIVTITNARTSKAALEHHPRRVIHDAAFVPSPPLADYRPQLVFAAMGSRRGSSFAGLEAAGIASTKGSSTANASPRNASPSSPLSAHKKLGAGLPSLAPDGGSDYDTSMGDVEADGTGGAGGPSANGQPVHSLSPAEPAHKPPQQQPASSLLESAPLLDIAFLHAIASYRPLGPHKHFNIMPVLLYLDQTVRRLGPRALASTEVEEESSGSESDDNDDEASVDDGADGDEAGQVTRDKPGVKVKSEIDMAAPSNEATPLVQISPGIVWQRLGELYDVDGFDDLEEQAVDGDDKSPFASHPPASIGSRSARKLFAGNRASPPPAFGFGNGLVRLPKDASRSTTPASATPTKPKYKRQASTTKKGGRTRESTESSASNSEEEEATFTDFELGPWEDYEDLIAPRRRRGAAGEEASESDVELSSESPEEATKANASSSSRQQVQRRAVKAEEDIKGFATSKKRARSARDEEAAARHESVEKNSAPSASEEESEGGDEDEDDGDEDDEEEDGDEEDEEGGDGDEDEKEQEDEDKRSVKRGRQSTASSSGQTASARRGAGSAAASKAAGARGKRTPLLTAATGVPSSTPSPATSTRGTRSAGGGSGSGSGGAASSSAKPRRSGRR